MGSNSAKREGGREAGVGGALAGVVNEGVGGMGSNSTKREGGREEGVDGAGVVRAGVGGMGERARVKGLRRPKERPLWLWRCVRVVRDRDKSGFGCSFVVVSVDSLNVVESSTVDEASRELGRRLDALTVVTVACARSCRALGR